MSPYHYSITPALHYSSRLSHEGESLKAPLRAEQSGVIRTWILFRIEFLPLII